MRVGQAVNQLYYVESTDEVDAAIGELGTAVEDTRDHAGNALDDLSSQASDFRTNAPEVEQAFWEGVDSGLSGS
jgi:ABC-type transporter Mla subunit MlaD